MTDAVNHPPHYTSHPVRCECGRGIECIQIVEHSNFCIGNAQKYLWRADHKGNAIEDLQKARFYIDREIERRTKTEQVRSREEARGSLVGRGAA